MLSRIKKTILEGNNYIGSLSHVLNCTFGIGTYCGSKCSLINTRIGRFTSIASNVKVLFGEHPTKKWVSTYPGFYSPKTPTNLTFSDTQQFSEYKYSDPNNQIFVEIGNDVWIASDVKILSGVIIGDGAVILAGAIVTKNVEPYSIVGGVPARKVDQRFEDEEIDFLLQNKWWDKDIEWIKSNASLFSDIKEYKRFLSNNN